MTARAPTPAPLSGAPPPADGRGRRRGRAALIGATLAAALAVSTAGCFTLGPQAPTAMPSHREGEPPPLSVTEVAVPVDAPAALETYAAATRALADALRGASRSCAAVARALDAWTASHAETFRAALAEVDRWELIADRADVKSYHAALRRDVDVRIDAGQRCDRDRAARRAFDRFFAAIGFDTSR